MSRSKKPDHEFVEDIREALDKSVSEFDDATINRLTSIRQQAVANSQRLLLECSAPKSTEPARENGFPYLTAIAASVLFMVITLPMFRESVPNQSANSEMVAEYVAIEYWQEDPEFLEAIDMLAVLGDESAHEVL